ncbi:MAG: YggS family pyridoxal phosphate-dependent enzyme [Gemmatimonadaceae bacterium]
MPLSGSSQARAGGPRAAGGGAESGYAALPAALAEIRQRIDEARSRGGRGQDVRIVAVTKTHGPEAVAAAVRAGIGDVGENRVQEAIAKMSEVDVAVRWHLIGHLQRNKVREAGRFALIHSVDSERLAEALDREALRAGRTFDVLVQVNASGEASKGGFGTDEVPRVAERLKSMAGLRVTGSMTMAALGAGEPELRASFARARAARDVLSAAGHPAGEISMGMSQDYEIAVEEGATLVRLGTILFGARETR